DAVEAGTRSFALRGTVDEDVLLFWRQILEGSFEVDLVPVGCKLNELEEVLRRRAGAEATVEQRLGPIGDHLGWIEVVERAEAVALGTCSEGGVEGEAARFEFGNVKTAVGTGHRGGEKLFVGLVSGCTGNRDEDEPVG